MTLEEYCDRLLPHALLLAGAVRDEGVHATSRVLDAVRRTEPPPGVDPLRTLAVILAAMVPPDESPEELLGWARALAPVQMSPPPEDIPQIDWMKVARICNGDMPYSEASSTEKAEVIRQLHAEGLNDTQIAARAASRPEVVCKQRARLKLPPHPRRRWTA